MASNSVRNQSPGGPAGFTWLVTSTSDATRWPIAGPMLISPPTPLDEAGEAALLFGGERKAKLALLAALDQVLPEASPCAPIAATLSGPSTPPPQSPEASGVHRQGEGRQARSQREVLRDLSAYLQERLEVSELQQFKNSPTDPSLPRHSPCCSCSSPPQTCSAQREQFEPGPLQRLAKPLRARRALHRSLWPRALESARLAASAQDSPP